MKQNDNFLVTINDLRAAICTSSSILFRAYTPGPIIADDFIQEEPLVDLLLRSRDGAYSAYRLTVRPGQLLVYRDAMTPLEIQTSLDDELWISLKGESHHVERHYETAPGQFYMAIETKSWLVTDVLQIRWQTDSSLPNWASAVFIKDMAGRTICRYSFGKNLTDTSGGQAALEPVLCTSCEYPREAALYYVEYNRSFKSGAITHSWGFLCEKHLEEKRQWVLADPAHRAMRWLPVEEVPLRKFAYQVAHLTAVPEFWKASYLGERSLFYLDLREVFRSHWGFSKRDAQWIHHFVESCLRNQDTTLDNLAQILDEEHLPAAVITYLRNTLLIPAAI